MGIDIGGKLVSDEDILAALIMKYIGADQEEDDPFFDFHLAYYFDVPEDIAVGAEKRLEAMGGQDFIEDAIGASAGWAFGLDPFTGAIADDLWG